MTLTRSGSEIAEYFDLMMREEAILSANGDPLRPRFNIAPSQEIAAIRFEADHGRRLEWMRWGLIPSWAKDPSIGARLFNARSETAAVKPSFRSAFRHRRCLIAADGFYEWTPRNRGHQAYHFSDSEGRLLAFAGLFENWRGEGGEVIDSCTVLTTAANEDLADVHHRMPVILEPTQSRLWLDSETEGHALQDLLVPAPPNRLKRTLVGRDVNDARRDDPACMAPQDPPAQPDLFQLDGEN